MCRRAIVSVHGTNSQLSPRPNFRGQNGRDFVSLHLNDDEIVQTHVQIVALNWKCVMQQYNTFVYCNNIKHCVAEALRTSIFPFQGNVPFSIKQCKNANRQHTETVGKPCEKDTGTIQRRYKDYTRTGTSTT